MSVQFQREGLGERELDEVLTPEATDFLAELHERFEARRSQLVAARESRPAPSDFDPATAEVRESDWTCAPPRDDYLDRRTEITGPTDRKLVINALNSGARGFMADFEDANSPTWFNQVNGQVNLIDANAGTIDYDSSDGRHYQLGDSPATLLVRPRGWHLPESHFTVTGDPIAGGLFDFGLYAFHNAVSRAEKGQGLYLYLPKLEHYLEARLWNDVFDFTEDHLGLAKGTILATVLIETLPAAFQMEEILWELRDHSYGLNAGRWDYIFSAIKTLREDTEAVLPDRAAVTMTEPFRRAYTELLVKTCHRRATFAMGGMAALIPSRTDEEANRRAFEAVAADKRREAAAGFDGTWVAHPDVVEIAADQFDAVLGEKPNQIEKQREDVTVGPKELLDFASTPGEITEEGLRLNASVGFQYISFWLGGRGAAGINNLMEDAATAEISRGQIWQWIRHGVKLSDGRTVTRELVTEILDQELARIRQQVGAETGQAGRPDDTRQVFEKVALSEDFPTFLTLVAYPLLDS